MARKPVDTALVILDMINLFDYEGGAALARNTLSSLPATERLLPRSGDLHVLKLKHSGFLSTPPDLLRRRPPTARRPP